MPPKKPNKKVQTTQKVQNPETKRMITLNGKVYSSLIKKGYVHDMSNNVLVMPSNLKISGTQSVTKPVTKSITSTKPTKPIKSVTKSATKSTKPIKSVTKPTNIKPREYRLNIDSFQNKYPDLGLTEEKIETYVLDLNTKKIMNLTFAEFLKLEVEEFLPDCLELVQYSYSHVPELISEAILILYLIYLTKDKNKARKICQVFIQKSLNISFKCLTNECYKLYKQCLIEEINRVVEDIKKLKKT